MKRLTLLNGSRTCLAAALAVLNGWRGGRNVNEVKIVRKPEKKIRKSRRMGPGHRTRITLAFERSTRSQSRNKLRAHF